MLIKQVMARPVPTHPKWKYIRGVKRNAINRVVRKNDNDFDN